MKRTNRNISRLPRRGGLAALALSATLLAASGAAGAADLDDYGGYKDEAHGTGWIVTIGALPGFAPEYIGADSYRFNLIPLFSVRRAGQPADFIFPDDGLDYAVIDTGRFKLGPVGNLKSGRGEADDSRLVGLENYDWSVQAGAFGEFWLIPETFRTRVELLWGFESGDGFTANLAADWVSHIGAASFAIGPRMVIMDERTSQFEFGVTRAQSLINGYVAPYNASGGVQSVGVAATLNYPLTRNVNFMAFGRYDGLVNSASDSPITETFGSDSQFTMGVGLTYSFNYR